MCIFFFLTQKDNYDLNVNSGPRNLELFSKWFSNLIQTFINRQVLLKHCIGKGTVGAERSPDTWTKGVAFWRGDTYPLEYQSE